MLAKVVAAKMQSKSESVFIQKSVVTYLCNVWGTFDGSIAVTKVNMCTSDCFSLLPKYVYIVKDLYVLLSLKQWLLIKLKMKVKKKIIFFRDILHLFQNDNSIFGIPNLLSLCVGTWLGEGGGK